ncbi:hypothetical protein BDZ89DRAFT_1059621, partial [Hymenopellis radicata]
MMIMHGFEPMGSVPISPAVFEPFPERRAAYVDWDSPSVIEDIHGKPKVTLKQLLKTKLQPITRPLLSPFVVSTSNPYPPETDAPVVRAAKAVGVIISPLPHRPLWYGIQRRSSQRGATCWWRRTGTLLRRRRGGLVERRSRIVLLECAGEHLRLLYKLILLSPYAQRIPKHTHQPSGHRSLPYPSSPTLRQLLSSSLHVEPRPSGNPGEGQGSNSSR